SECAQATVTITVDPVNDPPVAEDDADSTDEDTSVTIDVLANDTDIDGQLDPAAVLVIDGPSHGVAGVDALTGQVTYTPELDWYGTESLTYQACDDGTPLPAECGTAMVTITVTAVNDPPIADAGPDQSVDTNGIVTLDGSGSSDVDGDLLFYSWTQVGGAPVTLSSTTGPSPTFAAPGDPAVFTFTLAVADSLGVPALTTDQVVVVIRNQLPVARAGPYQRVPINERVTLDSSSSHDPDDDLPLRRTWTQTGGPPVVLDDPTAEAPTFRTPNEPTQVVFALVVTDALGMPSVPEEVRITVFDPGIRQLYLPVVTRGFVPGPDLVVRSLTATGNTVTLKIANQGSAPVKDGFWVDVYINPHTVPTAANQPWYDLADQGLVWAVNGGALPGLVPGGEITLSVNDAYYAPDYSVVSWPIPAGTVFYAQVDSFNMDTTYGAVRETHEIAGRPYNNISGPFVSASAVRVELAATGPAQDLSLSGLPSRPQVAGPP
ncbi:MAG TPA: Ig-like domain-containing protein, partial [Anaerolineae bacterium]|nr:Ig-like domain-containing protein [Anaerolineae bacterium]